MLGSRSVRGRHEVAVVVDKVGLGDAPLQHFRRELVRVAEVGEADDVVSGLTVLDQCNGGDDFNATKINEYKT